MEISIPILFELLRNHSNQKAKNPLSKALVLEVFKTLSPLDSNAFAAGEESARVSAVRAVRHFLLSPSMDENYLFLSCLECMDIANWAGTSPARPPTLRAEDFQRIMQMLNMSDETICRKASTLFDGVNA
jgi:AP-4 complex subunit epsilon-1